MVWHDIFEEKGRYRLVKHGEFGTSRLKKWFNILGFVHVLSVIPTIIIFLKTENPGILILHFPILMLMFILSFTYGSDVVKWLPEKGQIRGQNEKNE